MTLSGEAAPADEVETARAKFFSDRQMNRRSGIVEKDNKDSRDSWTRAADRRALGGDDENKADGREKNDRHGRHDAQDRNGFGEKGDSRWNSNRGEERRQNGERPTGGWRDREQARRNGDRHHDEKDPEWMDDVVVKKDQELGLPPAKSQDEFQKWKESMNRKTKGEPEKEEVLEAPPPPPEPKPNSLKIEGFEQGSFFGFSAPSGVSTPPSATPSAASQAAKASGKGKTSRFASMFKPAAEEPPAPPPPESDVQKAANSFARTTAEDQEGFNRVLQMLNGGLKIGGQPTPTSETPSASSAPQSPPQPTRAGGGGDGSGPKPKSRFFQSQPKSPERLQSPQLSDVQLGGESRFDKAGRNPATTATGRDEQPRPPQQPTMTPDPSNMFNALREQQQRPSSGRVSEIAMFDPPSRSAPSPDINIQNLLAQQRHRPQQHSHESQNLLNLLKKSDVAQQQSRPPSQQTGGDHAQLQRWLDHQHQANSLGGSGSGVETYAPKPARLPQQPPGVFEEQLMRNFPSREDQVREQQMPPGMSDPRRQQQRAPPGFYDERDILMQQQQLLQQQQMRRNYADGPLSQLPSSQQPQQFRKQQNPLSMNHQQQYQGEYHVTSPNLSNGPPGFSGPHMPRGPPGFGGNAPQQHFQQREPPLPGSMPPGFGPPSSQGNAPPPPPGFYGAAPPPGFQNLRSQQELPPPPGMRRSAQFDPYEMGRRG